MLLRSRTLCKRDARPGGGSGRPCGLHGLGVAVVSRNLLNHFGEHMKALCWHATSDVRVDTVPDPTIQEPRDAVIKITSTAICGSDLHLFNGFQPTMEKGDVLGHENMGEVVAVGSGVSTPQDRRSDRRAVHHLLRGA